MDALAFERPSPRRANDGGFNTVTQEGEVLVIRPESDLCGWGSREIAEAMDAVMGLLPLTDSEGTVIDLAGVDLESPGALQRAAKLWKEVRRHRGASAVCFA